jgi:hypothetical protein
MRSRRSLKYHVSQLKPRKGVRFGHTEVNHKLDNLKTGDPFLPPDADTTRALEVVPVHNNVNHQVESNWDP